MKKFLVILIMLIIFLSSCSFNNNVTSLNEQPNYDTFVDNTAHEKIHLNIVSENNGWFDLITSSNEKILLAENYEKDENMYLSLVL